MFHNREPCLSLSLFFLSLSHFFSLASQPPHPWYSFSPFFLAYCPCFSELLRYLYVYHIHIHIHNNTHTHNFSTPTLHPYAHALLLSPSLAGCFADWQCWFTPALERSQLISNNRMSYRAGWWNQVCMAVNKVIDWLLTSSLCDHYRTVSS